MDLSKHGNNIRFHTQCTCGPHCETGIKGISRRKFLGGLAGTIAISGLTFPSISQASSDSTKLVSSGAALPTGAALRVQPVLAYQLCQPQEKSSWRSYGGLETPAQLNEEVDRINRELKKLSSESDFPIETLPLVPVETDEQVKNVLGSDCDVILVYAAGGYSITRSLVDLKVPCIMFLRHKSGPYYLYHEIALWRFLRRDGDTFARPGIDVDDIVVDDYSQILWRLRALYGLKNAKGTKMLAIGGLVAYSPDGQKYGPEQAKNLWGYQFEIISEADFAQRLKIARSDQNIIRAVEEQTNELLVLPNITLHTQRKFVVNSFFALKVCKDIMAECGATNFGFAYCMMKSVIEMLDTPPCLVLSLANDEGYTAYCHTDLTHTLPGVLLRWIAGKPTFLCNSHFPHDGIFTVAHCAAPRRMNGKDYEPAQIMTHFESDYGAASKVEYPIGQTVTVIIPNLRCTKWQGFRGKILGSPSLPACRSQIDISVDGDTHKLCREMEGFHTQVCYGDYLREIGYALKKLGPIEWQNFSDNV